MGPGHVPLFSLWRPGSSRLIAQQLAIALAPGGDVRASMQPGSDNRATAVYPRPMGDKSAGRQQKHDVGGGHHNGQQRDGEGDLRPNDGNCEMCSGKRRHTIQWMRIAAALSGQDPWQKPAEAR
jgi:hypothetical protein